LTGLSGGQGFASHPREGPRSAPRPSAQSLGLGGGPLASTAWPAVGTGPALLPATRRGSGLPLPTMASTPGVTSPSQKGTLELTTMALSPPDREGPPEHSHIPLSLTDIPGQPPGPLASGSTAVAQGGVTDTSPGPSHIPLSPQSAPGSGSAVTLLSTLLPSPGTSWGVLGFGPTVSTPIGHPSPGLPHSSSRLDPAASPPSLGGTQVGVGSLAPPSAPGPPQQPALSQPASPLGLTTAIGVTTPGVTADITTATSPERLGDMGTVTEPRAAVLQRDVVGMTWGSPPPVPTEMPGPPQQPTESHGGDPGPPPAAVDTDLAQPSSIPRGRTDSDTPQETLAGVGRAPQVFIVEDQPPLLRASILRIPCELVLDMGFVPALQDPGSPEHQELLHSFNQTVTPLFSAVPGFLRLEVTGIRWGSVVLLYEALLAAERLPVPGLDRLLEAALGSARAPPGLAVGTAPVLRHTALALDPCAELFACPPGFACVSGADGNATCTSLCHRGYCKNHGICSHGRDQQPRCRCPVGSDFWFMGLRCDHRVTQQGLLGMAAGVLLSIVLLGAVLAAVAVRRFKALLLEARADQTRSSYRRFCRLDDVSAQYWSRSGLPSASSLDNPAFSNSEELLHLQVLDSGCCGCRGDPAGAKRGPAPCAHPQCRPSFHYDWDTSSSSMNDPMVDSGKASDISVSSWPMEPTQWAPFPLLHQLSRQRPHKARWPQSLCEGLELGTLERSWTA
ncbi:IMPG2 protein, partial [Certhia brachydactyla]|nr:IMPG2 protein [Certhia brachydactyla]